jgi:hypothetical protein
MKTTIPGGTGILLFVLLVLGLILIIAAMLHFNPSLQNPPRPATGRTSLAVEALPGHC